LLEPTIPEQQGWVRREELFDFSGRTRKPQMSLAKSLSITDYPCSAGGCLLTDVEFSKRLKDLIAHDQLSAHNVALLKVGRHFRLSEKARLIVGRNEKEDMRLAELARDGDFLFEPAVLAGPTSLGKGGFSEELITFACRITCTYCDRPPGQETAEIAYRKIPDLNSVTAGVAALATPELEECRL
jgi:hypothetical protein